MFLPLWLRYPFKSRTEIKVVLLMPTVSAVFKSGSFRLASVPLDHPPVSPSPLVSGNIYESLQTLLLLEDLRG